MLRIRVTIGRQNGLSEAELVSDEPLTPMLGTVKTGHVVDRRAAELVEELFGCKVRP
jgi:hypothetical protein